MSQAEVNKGGGGASGSIPDQTKASGFLSRFFQKKSQEKDQGKGPSGAGSDGKDTKTSGAAPQGKKNLARDGIPTIVRKITKKEETAVKISEGLADLSQLMKNVGEQLDTHTQERVDLRNAMEPLQEFLGVYPKAVERSTMALEAIKDEVSEQRKSSESLLSKISDLPEAIRELPAVGKQQVTILQGVLRNAEEHNRKLTEVGASVESATSRNVEAIHDLKNLQQEALEVMTRNQQETYKEFDRRNNRQQKDLAGMISRTNKHHAVLMVVFLVVTLCAVSLAALLTKSTPTPLEAEHITPSVEVDAGDAPGR